ncbi:acyltransferase family protein [Mumia sp. zg.B21]|uniref:acyltransferase family protein n=1 Tax=unclassified Mumia TaxID=2621872 RepID=UPI001C6DEB49|nr:MULTISPECIES: acyltransferase family protein [unclassified Mumia]MBW9209333.1 acyltransferase family protein [Mumia sp. zg.B21]MDD9347509.1 acyltransferase family protein [Mumia sp.]
MSTTLMQPRADADSSVDAAARPAARDPLLDNARYWVMLLVVAGHALQYLLDVPAARGTYAWIYAFHMPAFVLVSGYVSRRYEGSPKQTRALVTTLVVPYIVLNVGLDGFRAVLDGKPLDINLLDPAWSTWFLIALVAWRLSTPLWQVVRAPVLVAIAVSLVAGLWQVSNVVSIHRILGLLPFYVAGMYLRPAHFAFLRRPLVRVVSALALAGTFAWCQLRHEGWYVSWLYWRDAYAESPLEADALGGLTTRAGLLVVGFALTAAVLSVIPRRVDVTTGLGRRTMNAYFLHGFVIIALAHVGAFDLLAELGPYCVPIVLVGAALLGTALMSERVARAVGPLLAPRMEWAFRRPAERPDEPGRSAARGRGVEERDVVAASGLGERR